MNRMWRMALRMLMKAGVKSGVVLIEKRGRDKAGDDPEARRQAAEASKRSRQTLRLMRRLFRF